jgi:hypothetical protein
LRLRYADLSPAAIPSLSMPWSRQRRFGQVAGLRLFGEGTLCKVTCGEAVW